MSSWNLLKMNQRIKNKLVSVWPEAYIGLGYLEACFCRQYKIKKTLSLTKYADKNGRIHVIEPEIDRCVYKPRYYRGTAAGEVYIKTPSIYLAELSNLYVHGGTGFLLAGDYVISDRFELNKNNRILYKYGPIISGTQNSVALAIYDSKRCYEEGINLCGIAATNYYHFTVEILSRMYYVEKTNISPDVPILLDASVKKCPTLLDLLHYITKREVIWVEDGEEVFIKKIIHPSMNTWLPFNVKHKRQFFISDNAIAESGVEYLRKCTASIQRNPKWVGKKIFISRKNSEIKRIINEDKLGELFEEAGYVTVAPEKLSFVEQVQLFKSAGTIVGASGAALTNLVYAEKSTVVGCIIPEEYTFCVYATIAKYVGCNMLFYNAEITKNTRFMSADQMMVDIEECRKYINELDYLRKEN